MKDQKTIGVFGIGAIGSVISVALNERHEVVYFNRSSRDALVVDFNGQRKSKSIELAAIDNGIDCDWLIICLKEYHFEQALPDIVKLLRPFTKVAIVRNGLNLKEPLLAHHPTHKILECIIDCPTQSSTDGIYQQIRRGKITIAENECLGEFRQLFQNERVDIVGVKDFHSEKWKKLIESSSLGSILTVFNRTCEIFAELEYFELYKKVLKEGIAVALKDGAYLPPDFSDELIDKLKRYPGDKGSSMLTDRLNHRPIEWRAKNGIISSVGRRYNIRTDLNDLLCLLLKEINNP